MNTPTNQHAVFAPLLLKNMPKLTPAEDPRPVPPMDVGTLTGAAFCAHDLAEEERARERVAHFLAKAANKQKVPDPVNPETLEEEDDSREHVDTVSVKEEKFHSGQVTYLCPANHPKWNWSSRRMTKGPKRQDGGRPRRRHRAQSGYRLIAEKAGFPVRGVW